MNNNTIAVVGRVLLAAIFVFSGIGKVMAPSATIGYIASVGLPFPALGFAAAVIVELGGGLALAFGYRTRIVAAILALFCIVTALIFHNNIADQNQLINLMKNFAMAGGLLHVMAFAAAKVKT